LIDDTNRSAKLRSFREKKLTGNIKIIKEKKGVVYLRQKNDVIIKDEFLRQKKLVRQYTEACDR